MIVLAILSITNTSNISISKNYNFNTPLFSNKVKVAESRINIKALNKNGNFYSFSNKMGILSSIGDKERKPTCVYFVDNRGNLQLIQLNGKNINNLVEFYCMSDTLGIWLTKILSLINFWIILSASSLYKVMLFFENFSLVSCEIILFAIASLKSGGTAFPICLHLLFYYLKK